MLAKLDHRGRREDITGNNAKQRLNSLAQSKLYHIQIYHVVLFRLDVSSVSKEDRSNVKTPNIFIMHQILQNK